MATLPWLSPTSRKILSLAQARASIFQTAFNPTSIRTGAKYLRKRLRGPSMMAYYPERIDIASVIKSFPQLGMVNEQEQMRLEDIETRRKRGKGAPKKQGKGESRRAGKKR